MSVYDRMPASFLVVDADHERLRQTSDALLSAGHRVTRASTFHEAKRRLRLTPPDVLVTNVRLGAYNGLHLLLRARADFLRIPAIVMDVHHDAVLERETTTLGAVYVARPLGRRSLVALVRQVLETDSLQPLPVERRHPRKTVAISAIVADRQAQVVDASYGGLRLELPGIPNARLLQPSAVRIPSVGMIPVRPIWVRGASIQRVWWCGAELATADASTTVAWRTFVDSLN